MKKQYALLRNNIQIGLFTLKEISKMELFPTDLIWVQAKSIAWLSPDKIDELKQYVKPAAQVVYPEVAIRTTQATQTEQPERVVDEMEITSKSEIEESSYHDNHTADFEVATQGEQPETVFDEMEITSKSEIEESSYHDNHTDAFEVATQGEQQETVVDETVITSKSEIEESSDHDNNTDISEVVTQSEQPETVVNETEFTSKSEIEESPDHYNDADISEVATPGKQLEPVVDEMVITLKSEIEESFAHDNDISEVVTPGKQPEPVNAINQIEIISKTQVEEVRNHPETGSNKSFGKAYVLLPDPHNGKKEVALRTEVNEVPDAGKSSVTPYVMKPETPRNTEGRVYVKFPLGVPQSLFYRNEKSIEDKLESKASEVSNTKIYAAKPKPRNLL